MKLPEYISQEEVRRVCRELGLQDWTQLEDGEIVPADAAIVRTAVGQEALEVSVETFRNGLQVELEHGRVFPESNVTNNHPLLTGLIVVAHLKETLDYYERLEVVELEGDLLKAVRARDADKAARILQRLTAARAHLAELERAALEPSLT